MSQISINIALARMQQTIDENARPVTFAIEFVKNDGTLRTMNAQQYVKNPQAIKTANDKSKFGYNLKSRNTILLFDVDEKQYRTIRVDRITRFNHMDVIH